MTRSIIGIAGGSGSGKTAVCAALQEKYPTLINVLHLDDYYKLDKHIPEKDGFKNYDHPDAIDFDQLVAHVLALYDGKSVVVYTKDTATNPDFERTGARLPVLVSPKPIVLVEGFLVLHDARLRGIYTDSIWLDLDPHERYARRVHMKNNLYSSQVLFPMHAMYAEPTKVFAGHIVSIDKKTLAQVVEEVESTLAHFLKLESAQ